MQMLQLVGLLILAAGVSAETGASVEAWVASRRAHLPYSLAPGVTGLVVLPSGASHTFASGVRSATLRDPVDEHSLMEIGSLSKTVTCLGLARLVAAGRLSWDDPVRKWLPGFQLGPHEYVSSALTVKDLLAHRSGLGEDQAEFPTAFIPADRFVRSLRAVKPVHTLRDRMEYSNTGWIVAGEVLRAATNRSDWCAAVTATVMEPLNLTRTYCTRNHIPAEVAASHLAAVHKMDPCRGGNSTLATYDFVATGAPADFAWGAADASGSVISSVNEMRTVLRVLLGHLAAEGLPYSVLNQMLTGQVVTPPSWNSGCGVPGWEASGSTAGSALGAGLGFDLAGEIELIPGKTFRYAEKNGDTNMHKARLGLLPRMRAGVLMMSNLGGSMGGPLTALKFGALAVLAGASFEQADAVAERTLETTQFWQEQWPGLSTCSACGAAVGNRRCLPSGVDKLPLPAAGLAGSYVLRQTGTELRLRDDGPQLRISLGPVNDTVLLFSNRSQVVADVACTELATKLQPMLSPWSSLASLAALPGRCSLLQFVLQPEIELAGVSDAKRTVAFPWGCGYIPLPDGPSVDVVAHGERGVVVMYNEELLWRKETEHDMS